MIERNRTQPVARLVDPRAVETLDVLGATARLITAPAEDDGAPCIIRGTIPPGTVVPLHSHADPETFLAISGWVEGLVHSPEGFAWVAVRPGDVFHVPGDAKHAWRNDSREPAESMIITTARLGRFFREIGTPLDPGREPGWPPSGDAVERFLAIAERYGYWNATPEENAEVGLAPPTPD